MVADKGSKPSQLALAALVRALDNKSQVAIVRAMMRAQGSVALMVAVPVLATGAAPDHFVINELPFQEDIRWFTFAPFSREDKLPDADQMKATRNLVDAMTLDVQTRPELAPETTPNPALHRFIQFVCDKAVDDDVKVPEPEDDALLTCVTQPRVEVMPKAAQAAAAAGAAFPTGMKARGAGRAVRRLRPGYELDDFTEMMEQGSFTDAISAMRKHIESLVDASVGAHHFQEALQKLKAVREQCVQRKVAKTFNEHLRHLWGKYAELPMKRAFLGMVGQEGITLVSRDDVDVVGAVTPEEAALFLEKANAAAENGE